MSYLTCFDLNLTLRPDTPMEVRLIVEHMLDLPAHDENWSYARNPRVPDHDGYKCACVPTLVELLREQSLEFRQLTDRPCWERLLGNVDPEDKVPELLEGPVGVLVVVKNGWLRNSVANQLGVFANWIRQYVVPEQAEVSFLMTTGEEGEQTRFFVDGRVERRRSKASHSDSDPYSGPTDWAPARSM